MCKQQYLDLVSIIVPVYNVEKYLDRCINSILNQTYKYLDIVLVNDGSLDRSGYICNKYKEWDDRINVIHKCNGGLSETRNVGIIHAKGKYIVFIDSDDYVSPDYIEYLLGLLKFNNSQIAMCNYVKGKEWNYQFDNTKDEDNKQVNLPSDEMLSCLLYQRLGNSSAWTKIFEKNLFNDISFPVNRIHEDIAIIYKVFSKAKRITYGEGRKYYYYQRYNSIVNSGFDSRKMDYIFFTNECIEYMSINYPKIKKAAISRHFSACCQALSRIPSANACKKEYSYIKNEIECYRKIVILDKNVRAINRIAALFSYCNYYSFYLVLKLFFGKI